MADLEESDGFRLDGEINGNLSGLAVSDAGDVNGDGFADVIISAYGRNDHGTRSGSSYVVFGQSDGFGSLVQLSDLDGSDGFRLDGEAKPLALPNRT